MNHAVVFRGLPTVVATLPFMVPVTGDDPERKWALDGQLGRGVAWQWTFIPLIDDEKPWKTLHFLMGDPLPLRNLQTPLPSFPLTVLIFARTLLPTTGPWSRNKIQHRFGETCGFHFHRSRGKTYTVPMPEETQLYLRWPKPWLNMRGKILQSDLMFHQLSGSLPEIIPDKSLYSKL